MVLMQFFVDDLLDIRLLHDNNFMLNSTYFTLKGLKVELSDIMSHFVMTHEISLSVTEVNHRLLSPYDVKRAQ